MNQVSANVTPKWISMDEMEPGQYARIVQSPSCVQSEGMGCYVVKGIDGIVCLEIPLLSFNPYNIYDYKVEILPPGSGLMIEVDG